MNPLTPLSTGSYTLFQYPNATVGANHFNATVTINPASPPGVVGALSYDYTNHVVTLNVVGLRQLHLGWHGRCSRKVG